MPETKYKTPNGKIASNTELQNKYGNRLPSLIESNTFIEITEPIYKTPNGKYEVESVLKEKYGDRFDELVATNMFALDTPLKKKENSDSTAANQKLDSGQEADVGLSATPQGQLVKDIDEGKFDKRIEDLQLENKKLETEQKEKESNYSVPEELFRSLEKGSARLGEMVGAIPELLYDVFAIPQNALSDPTNYPYGIGYSLDKRFDLKNLEADSEKFKDYIGAENIIKDYYSGKVDLITKEQEAKDKPIIGDITTNIKKGNVSDAFRLIGKSVSESLPATIGIALSGGAVSTPQMVAGVTTVFGAGENEEYKKQNPDMSNNERVFKSLGKGMAEGVYASIGSAKIGVAAKELLAKEGVEEGSKILKTQLVNMYTQLLKKYPIPTAMLGEGIEEAATQITQNAIDSKPIMEGVSDAFIIGNASGGGFGVVLEGIKHISKDKTTSNDIKHVEASLNKKESIKAELTQQVREGDLKPREAKDIYDNWEDIKNQLKAIPEDFTPEQKAKAVDLIKEKKKLEKEIDGKDSALVENKKAKIEDINNKLKQIQNIDAKSETTTTETEKQEVETTTPITETEEKGIADIPSPTVELNPKNTSNETAQKTNIELDGSVSTGVKPSEQQGESKNIQPTANNTSNKEPTEIKLGKTNKAQTYIVVKNNKGELTVLDSKGEIIPSTYKDEKGKTKKGRRNDILFNYTDTIDLTEGKPYEVPKGVGQESSSNIDEDTAKNSQNPAELAEIALRTANKNYIQENIDPAVEIILEYIYGNVKRGKKGDIGNDGSFVNQDDDSSIGISIGKTYLNTKGKGLDVLAQELSGVGLVGREVDMQEIIDLMKAYPNGVNDLYKSVRDKTSNPAKQNFTEITGLPASDRFLLKAIEQQNKKDKLDNELNNNYLSQLTEEELLNLHHEAEQFKQQRETNSSNESANTKGNTLRSKGEPEVQQPSSKQGDTEQASQGSVKSLTKERIKPSKQKPKGPAKKLNDIIAEVSDKLKSTLVYGKTRRRNTSGTYNPSNTLVKIRRAGDLDTVAHELGHLLDDKHDIVGNTKGHADELTMIKQLKWFSDRGGSNPPSSLSAGKKEAYLEREGLAEFIRAYIANPKKAKVIAPELYAHFESSIDDKTKTILKDFSQDFLDFANATYGEQILSNVENSTLPNKTGFKAWLDLFKSEEGKLNIHWLDKVKSNWTNSMHVANKAFAFVQDLKGKSIKDLKPKENFEVISRLLSGINGKINNALGKGLVDGKNKLMKDSEGKVMNINYLLEILDDTSENTLRNEMDSVIKLLIAERTVEYVKKFERTDNLTGIGGGIKTDLEVAQGHLNELSELKKDNLEQYNRIKEGARRYREFADAGLKYAVEKGRISQEQYDRIKATNQYYVTLARTKEVTPGEEILPFLNDSNKISSVKEVIKKAKGGSDAIKNPYMSLLHNTVNFIKESDRNEVMQSFVEPLTNVRNMGEDNPIDFSQIARQVSSGEKNTIKVYKDGELQHWQFDQDIYEALKGLEGISHNKLINYLGKPADLIRFTVTNFPVFALRNAFRDTMSRLVISRTRGKISDLWHDHNDREMFEAYGGSQAGFYLTNKDAYVEEMNKAVKYITKKGGIILDPRKLNYKNYRKILERGENLNRVAEYKSAYRKAKKDGMDDYNAGLYAAYQARDLMDFAVAGHWMRTINKLIPFSNASVQSVKRSVKGAKENPGKFTLRMAMFTLVPQLAFRALVHANGDDDEYEQLPDYQRDLFWNFKTPFTGDVWISLPKPFELGLPSSLIDRGISKTQGNNDAFDGATMSSIKTLFPFDEATLVGSLKPIIEASSNHDFFRGRDIVPFWEKEKLLELREGTKYASRIGQILSKGFGLIGAEVDPRKIDHIIKGYTTYYGDWALSLGDIGKEDSRNQFNVTKTGFAKDMPISNAKSVKKAYDLAESIGARGDKNVKALKGLVKAYYDLEDKAERKKMSKIIYEFSNSIIPYLEAKKTIKLLEANTPL